MILSKKLQAEWRPRRRFRALSFDGVDDYVEVPHASSLDLNTEVTFLAFVKPSSRCLGTYKNIIEKSGASPIMWINPNSKPYFGAVVDGLFKKAVSPIAIEMDKWHLLGGYALSNGTTTEIGTIVDIGVVETTTFSGSLSVSTYPILIGIDYAKNEDYYFVGKIAMMFIYNCVLNDTEIKQLNDNPFNPPRPENLVLWLAPGSIDTGAGKWYDLSQYGNHGTIYGAQVVEEAVREVIVK